jgi:hypothetical protein
MTPDALKSPSSAWRDIEKIKNLSTSGKAFETLFCVWNMETHKGCRQASVKARHFAGTCRAMYKAQTNRHPGTMECSSRDRQTCPPTHARRLDLGICSFNGLEIGPWIFVENPGWSPKKTQNGRRFYRIFPPFAASYRIFCGGEGDLPSAGFVGACVGGRAMG